VVRLLMALHACECWWLAMVIEAIKAPSARMDVLEEGGANFTIYPY